MRRQEHVIPIAARLSSLAIYGKEKVQLGAWWALVLPGVDMVPFINVNNIVRTMLNRRLLAPYMWSFCRLCLDIRKPGCKWHEFFEAVKPMPKTIAITNPNWRWWNHLGLSTYRVPGIVSYKWWVYNSNFTRYQVFFWFMGVISIVFLGIISYSPIWLYSGEIKAMFTSHDWEWLKSQLLTCFFMNGGWCKWHCFININYIGIINNNEIGFNPYGSSRTFLWSMTGVWWLGGVPAVPSQTVAMDP